MIIEKLPAVQSLSMEEKQMLAEEIWDEISQLRDPEPVPNDHLALLEERMVEYQQNPEAVKSWEAVKADLASRFGDSKQR